MSLEPVARPETVPVAIRLLDTMGELVETERIQQQVWGLADRDVVPAAQLRAVAHAGGHVSAAFLGDEMAGFAYGFVAAPHGEGMTGIGLHSHMVAVRPTHRGRGVGLALKWAQRQWCLDRGLSWVTWTFDPLQAKNANLNLRHLGAICNEYIVDFYGRMPGHLGGGQESDRLLALWLLDSPQVVRAAEAHARGGQSAPSPDTSDEATWLFRQADVVAHRDENAELFAATVATSVRTRLAAGRGRRSAGQPTTVRIPVPTDVTSLLANDPALAQHWRVAVRAAMTEALSHGMSVSGFKSQAYILRRDAKAQSKL